MAVSLEVEVVGSATSDAKYKVTWTVVTNVDMPAEIFLHTRSTERFDGVIVPADLDFPTSPDPSTGYYRKNVAEQVYPDIATAESAQTNVNQAIEDLVTMYKDGLVNFLATNTNSYS